MTDKTITTPGGIGYAALLTIVFIALKLLGVIAWSWWWVLSPLWIGIPVVIVIMVLIVAALVVKDMFE
jgi:hypothetical protein